MAIRASALVRIGVTGHRDLGDNPLARCYTHVQCVRILDHLLDMAGFRNMQVEAYSALAAGADQLFAQAALGLGVPLFVAIPFADYPNDFEGDDRTNFEFLLSQARKIYRLPYKRRSNKAYLDVGKWIVSQVEYLIAVWDGKPAAGMGGTADIVAYARKHKRVVLRIDPADAPPPN